MHLGNVNFYVVELSVEDRLINVLHKSEYSYFGQNSGFKSFKGFSVIVSNSELVAQLGKQRFYTFSTSLKYIRLGLVIDLIFTIGTAKVILHASNNSN